MNLIDLIDLNTDNYVKIGNICANLFQDLFDYIKRNTALIINNSKEINPRVLFNILKNIFTKILSSIDANASYDEFCLYVCNYIVYYCDTSIAIYPINNYKRNNICKKNIKFALEIINNNNDNFIINNISSFGSVFEDANTVYINNNYEIIMFSAEKHICGAFKCININKFISNMSILTLIISSKKKHHAKSLLPNEIYEFIILNYIDYC